MKSLLSRIGTTVWSWIKGLINRVQNWWESHLKPEPTKKSDETEETPTTDDTKKPEEPIKTRGKKTPRDKYKSWLSKIPPIPRRTALTEWSQLSQQLLRELFAELGVEYVPSIVLHESKHHDPVSAFMDFCKRFDTPEKPATREYLQNVVLFLFHMDDLRRRYPLNTAPIYEQLEQHQLDKAENLLEGMKKAIDLLEKLDSREEIRLGQYRNFLNDSKDILSLKWFECLDEIDKLYSIHLEWQESEKQYRLFQEQIVIRIRTIDEHGKIDRKDFEDAYKNIKRIWSDCITFLEEEAGKPDDPKRGFPKLELIRDALGKILEYCGESVSEPVDESGMSLEKAWEVLGLESGTLDSKLVKKAFRKMAMKYHPDRCPEKEKKKCEEKFKQIRQADNILQEECRRHHG